MKKNKKDASVNLIEIPRMLVLCDLDGTLLNNNNKISSFSERIIKKFTSRGNIFCIATGRPFRGSINLYKQLNLNSILVNFNGSFMCNPSNSSYRPLNLGFNKSILAKILQNEKIIDHIENILVEHSHGYALYREPSSKKEVRALFDHFHLENTKKITYIKKDLSNIKGDIHSILLDLKSNTKHDKLFFEIKRITSTLIVRN
jgi:HAD superfamily hydrolase (TIGR01484 family)